MQQRYNNYNNSSSSNSSSNSPILIFLRSLFQFKIFFIFSVFAFDRVVVVIGWISFVHCCCCCFCFAFILKSTSTIYIYTTLQILVILEKNTHSRNMFCLQHYFIVIFDCHSRLIMFIFCYYCYCRIHI